MILIFTKNSICCHIFIIRPTRLQSDRLLQQFLESGQFSWAK
ncbi:hypothetical protein F383_32694 [Gossypium arboreum]|uniref:Uncharacterized protein n=1 Tax=Gossypium arboreum TaxID=29729 RepID=A0A0B0N291_GOSAR|nr:hypothetical protein F383_32694 [Gossypium arboreum]